jgi:hypothetical protein
MSWGTGGLGGADEGAGPQGRAVKDAGCNKGATR